MKVRELIEKLSKFNQDLDVAIYIGDFGYEKVSDAESIYLAPSATNKFADYDAVEADAPESFEAVYIS